MEDSSVIVVGAGVAGLICALELQRAGRSVLVLDRNDDVGGRVRSRVIDGFIVDDGFQVLFTAYPTLMSYLDLPALAPRRFIPGARIVRHGTTSLMGDALRDPGLLLDTIFAGAVSLGDKLRLLALRRTATSLTVDECFAPRFDAVSTADFLRARGFSRNTIDGFFAPFYGGILLDRTLATSASMLLFTFKMLAEGDTVVPAAGMGAIPAQLAAQLQPGSVRVGVAVRAIQHTDGRATGVVLDDGTRFEARNVVIAAEAPSAAALAATAGVALAIPTGARGCTTVYYTTERSPLPGKALWLNAEADATISHVITMTDVAPEYDTRATAQGGPARALIAATAVGPGADLDDDRLDAAAQRDIAMMGRVDGNQAATLPDGEVPALTRLAICRVPYSQFLQLPGSRARRETISCGLPGLWRAGETLHSSSLEGAARGGRDAALALVQGSPVRS